MSTSAPLPDYQDVLIVGAGVAGINAGYRLQKQCPNLSYTILERRDNIGGTWSFFKYPGIRSDSDLFTFGFSWEPWSTTNPIAGADSIVTYVRYAAKKHGVDQKVRFGVEVTKLDWSSVEKRWTLTTKVTTADGQQETVVLLKAHYVIVSTGFFDYREALAYDIPGLYTFKGPVVHPQFWPEDLDYTDKRVAVIGSGATAVTLIPAIAKDVSKVTMVQRSPTYFHSMVMDNPVDNRIRAWLSPSWAAFVLRWKYLLLTYVYFYFCLWYPDKAKEVFLKGTQDMLPPEIAWDPHFKPTYKVWDQRICVCPDGDFFEALQSKKADVKTGRIDRVEGNAIVMGSGERIEADIIITATGLKVQMLGGAELTIDGSKPVDIGDRYMWRGTMIQGIPNAVVVIGYWNNSWTLGADLAIQIFIKTVRNALARGTTTFTPTVAAEEEQNMVARPLWNMSSTYLKTGNSTYPKASSAAPWQMKDNYMRDWYAWKRNDLLKGMVFGQRPQFYDQKRA